MQQLDEQQSAVGFSKVEKREEEKKRLLEDKKQYWSSSYAF